MTDKLAWDAFATATRLESKNETLLPPEYYSTLDLLCDIDFSLINAQINSPDVVKKKVKVFNKFLNTLRTKSGLTIRLKLLTQRPDHIFFDEETKDIYGPLLEIDSGEQDNNKSVLCEFGAVDLTTQTNWNSHEVNINESIIHGANKDIEVLTELLHKAGLISEDGRPDYPRFLFRKEPGTHCFFGLQLHNNMLMTEAEKKDLAEQVQKIVEENESIKGRIQIRIKEDVDCIPSIIDEKTKSLGVEAVIKIRKEQGEDWFGKEHIMVIDDKFHAAGKAFVEVLLSGGIAATQANADDQAKEIMHNINGVDLDGIISNYQVFLGTLDVIWQAVMGTRLPKKQVHWILREISK